MIRGVLIGGVAIAGIAAVVGISAITVDIWSWRSIFIPGIDGDDYARAVLNVRQHAALTAIAIAAIISTTVFYVLWRLAIDQIADAEDRAGTADARTTYAMTSYHKRITDAERMRAAYATVVQEMAAILPTHPAHPALTILPQDDEGLPDQDRQPVLAQDQPRTDLAEQQILPQDGAQDERLVLPQDSVQDERAILPRTRPQILADSASVESWINDYVDRDQSGLRILYGDAYDHYRQWCKVRGKRPLTKAAFTVAMTECGWPELRDAGAGVIQYRAKIGGKIWFYGAALRARPPLAAVK